MAPLQTLYYTYMTHSHAVAQPGPTDFFFFVNAETTVVNTDPTVKTRVGGGVLDLTGSLRVMDVASTCLFLQEVSVNSDVPLQTFLPPLRAAQVTFLHFAGWLV